MADEILIKHEAEYISRSIEATNREEPSLYICMSLQRSYD